MNFLYGLQWNISFQQNALSFVLVEMSLVFMDLELFRIIVDASLFILIWIVQLVIYPGFCYYSEANLKRWHGLYTIRITYIVLPLMVSQLGVYLYRVYLQSTYSTLGELVLVMATWAITFFVSVPLHQKIEVLPDSMEARNQLVHTNWIRTVIWTIILAINLISYAK